MSIAQATAKLKAQTLTTAQVASYRDSCLGNQFARRLMDTGTGWLEPQPVGHRWDLGCIFMQFDTDVRSSSD